MWNLRLFWWWSYVSGDNIECNAVIMWSIFSKNPHKRNLIAPRHGEIWGVFRELKLWCIFCLSHWSDVCNIMLYWNRVITAFNCISEALTSFQRGTITNPQHEMSLQVLHLGNVINTQSSWEIIPSGFSSHQSLSHQSLHIFFFFSNIHSLQCYFHLNEIHHIYDILTSALQNSFLSTDYGVE